MVARLKFPNAYQVIRHSPPRELHVATWTFEKLECVTHSHQTQLLCPFWPLARVACCMIASEFNGEALPTVVADIGRAWALLGACSVQYECDAAMRDLHVSSRAKESRSEKIGSIYGHDVCAYVCCATWVVLYSLG
jgi:hypothetical protein